MSKKNLWQNLLDNFSASSCPYIIVGGAALVLHGIPRSTLDIDIFVPAEYETLQWFFNKLGENRLFCKDADIKHLLQNPSMLIGQWLSFSTKKGVNIVDIFVESDKDFYHLYRNAEKIKTLKGSLTVVAINDLLSLKKKSGRDIDIADIALIKKWQSI